MTPTQTTETESEGGSFLTQKEKPEGEKKPEAESKPEGEKKPEEAPQGAPEKYEDFKLPEGYTLDPEAGKEITSLFKDLNLPQESAQKLVDYYSKNLLQTAEAPYKAWADLQKEWNTEIQDRFGSKADTVRRDINSAINNALPPSLARSFRAALDLTGAGTNPDIIEALSIFARVHTEGRPVPAGGQSKEANKAPGAPQAPSLAEAMYPHLAANRGQ